MSPLRTELLRRILLLVLLPVLVLSGVSIGLVRDRMGRQSAERLSAASRGVELELAAMAATVQRSASALVDLSGFVRVIGDGDRQTLLRLLGDAAYVLNLDVVTAIDSSGVVLARSHQPGNYGDRTILRSLTGGAGAIGPTRSFAMTPAGVAFRIAVPVVDGGVPVGEIQFARSLDHALLREMSQYVGLELAVYRGEVLQATTVTGADEMELLDDLVAAGAIRSADARVLAVAGHLASVRAILSPGGSVLGRVVVLLPTAESDATVRTLAAWFVGAALLFATIAATMARRLAAGIVAPVQELLAATGDIGAGRLERRVRLDRQDEIGELAAGFNVMGERLQATTTGVENLQHEINERKSAEEEVRQLRDRLQDTVDSLAAVLLVCNTELGITGWNRQAQRMSEAMPLTFETALVEAFPRLQEHIFAIAELIRSGEAFPVRRIDSGTGRERRVENLSASLLRRDDEVIGAVILLDDITAQDDLEEQLRRAEKMKTIGEIAGGIAHDFNNQLQIINASAQLLGDAVLSADDAESVQLIAAAGRRSADLTGQLLAFSRQGPSKAVVVRIGGLLSEVHDLLARTLPRSVTVEFTSGAEDLAVVGDASLLQSAVLNLCINARDAMPDGGTLRVDAAPTVLSSADCAAFPDAGLMAGPYVQITVRDTGTGIPPDVLGRIFEPFFTTKGIGGTGLGLSAVYGTVAKHGGGVSVESTPGAGTTFRIVLPRAEEADFAPYAGKAARRARVGPARILIVDDEPQVAEVMAKMLEKFGHDTTVITDPLRVPAWYEAHAGQVDLVFLDMNMPGINGCDLFQQLKEIDPDVRAVLATGFGDPQFVDRTIRLGILQVLRKPFGAASLATLLREVLGDEPGAGIPEA